jgi:hypothetical protein
MSARALFGTRRDETTAMRRKQLRHAKHCGTIDQTQTCLRVQHARCPRTRRGHTAIQTTTGRNVAALRRAKATPRARNAECTWRPPTQPLTLARDKAPLLRGPQDGRFVHRKLRRSRASERLNQNQNSVRGFTPRVLMHARQVSQGESFT